MPRRYRLIVFDWDGTLMDSAAAIVESIQSACQDLGLSPPDEHRARHVIGLGLGDALRHAVPDLPQSDYSKMVDRYRHHYLSRDHDLRLFDGVVETLDELKAMGYRLAIATGKSRIGLDRALTVSGVSDRFDASRCADECSSKPHPQMLHELLDEFTLCAGHAVMIGDTTHDLQMASNAGVEAIGVTYGAHSVQALRTCAFRSLVDDVQSLMDWIRSHG